MHVALETIKYQINDRFPTQLKSLVARIYSDIDNDPTYKAAGRIDRHPALKDIEALIFDRFGLSVLFRQELKVLSSAAIIPFFKDYERSNVQVQEFIDSMHMAGGVRAVKAIEAIVQERRATAKRIHSKTGFVNTKLARVGGYMSEVRHYLILNFEVLKSIGITASEAVAITLHEIGHAFDGLEEHYRTQTTNRAILDILNDLNNNSPDKALYRYRHTFTGKEYVQAQLSSSRDRQDFCADLARRYMGETKSQLQSAKYDETNFENMADSFATRFGMGKELASGIGKLYTLNGAYMKNNAAMRCLASALDTMALVAVFLLIPVYGFIVYTVVMSYLLRVSNSDMTYDGPIERVQRIRNTIVNGLKNKDLPKDFIRDALDQIEFIETMASQSVVYKSMLSELGDLMYSDARKDAYYIDLQQTIESQLNNRLFIQSAQLRTIS